MEKQTQNAEKQKHDKGYKGLLSNNAVFLHFLKKYFAESWTDNISTDDLEQVDKSFITEEYRNIDSDLIYKLNINGSDVYFYVLIELQSDVDFTMPFRLLRYMVELLNVIFKNTDKDIRERKDFRLPAIVPIVLYNGKDNWTPAMTYREFTEKCELFGNNIIDFRYLLLDLNRTDEKAIEPIENPLDAIFIVEKMRIRKKLTLDNLSNWWQEKTSAFSDDDKNMLINWIDKVYFNGKISPEIMEVFKNNPMKGSVTMKSLVDEWVEEGEHRGMEKRTLEFAKKMKDKGKSIDEIIEMTDLTVDDVLRL
jgi:predicted transposase/invertase (TIGR01784 family)